MNITEKEQFCDQWLKAWTGNLPELLLSFYDDSAFYLDPVNKNGLKGKENIEPYFKKLLARNPDWEWKRVEILETERGFVLKWQASIPMGDKIINENGLDIVEIINGKITRNEVYFDRSSFLLLKI